MKVVLVAGAASGVAWWLVSLFLGAGALGIVGAHPAAGVFAGLATGIVIAAISMPVYRKLPARHLLWYSPASVYVAIALYGALLFVVRSIAGDFHPDQISWAVGVQSVMGMWWGVTFLTHIAVAVHLLAYGNHRLLRRIANRMGKWRERPGSAGEP